MQHIKLLKVIYIIYNLEAANMTPYWCTEVLKWDLNKQIVRRHSEGRVPAMHGGCGGVKHVFRPRGFHASKLLVRITPPTVYAHKAQVQTKLHTFFLLHWAAQIIIYNRNI